MIIKNSKKLSKKNENPIYLAERLQAVYEDNYNIFSELVLKPAEIKPRTIKNYGAYNYILKLNSNLPSVFVCIENISKYTLHCSMRIEEGIVGEHKNVYNTPYNFRMKLYLDAKLLEIYDINFERTHEINTNSGISTKILDSSNTENKLVKSTFLNQWLKTLLNSEYHLLNV
ncbi:MAG: hypothetical protein MK218_03780 [Gammaproteobacteria bacterium]|jgi:hypothetical protein|nr:hypothetical protein [Gammaproteobacteria bacterium]